MAALSSAGVSAVGDAGGRLGLESPWSSLIDLMPAAIWITDGDQIAYANAASAVLFGACDRQQLIGQSIYALLRTSSHAAVRLLQQRALIATDAPQRLRERIACLDGNSRDVEIAMVALPDHGRRTLQMVISDISDHAHVHRTLQKSGHDLQRFTVQLLNAREAERRRIARELHDDLGQRLQALKLALKGMAAASTPPSEAAWHDQLNALLTQVDETSASVRRIAFDLRPAILDDLGLTEAIESLARRWSLHSGLPVQLQLMQTDARLGDAVMIALYRIAQESLTNIGKHAGATQVWLALQSADDGLTLVVEDNGTGLDEATAQRNGGHGLLGMRERCRLLGGSIEFGRSVSGGMRIVVWLPLAPAQRSAAAGPTALSGDAQGSAVV